MRKRLSSAAQEHLEYLYKQTEVMFVSASDQRQAEAAIQHPNMQRMRARPRITKAAIDPGNIITLKPLTLLWKFQI